MTTTVKRRRLVKEIPEQQPHPDPSESENRLKMVTGAFYIRKNNESKPLGEDAYFICNQNHTFGVSDGVGSWSNKGIDAGIYARELMYNVALSIGNNYQEAQNVHPERVLNKAFLNSKAQGSSTALIDSVPSIATHDDVLPVATTTESQPISNQSPEYVSESQPFNLTPAPQDEIDEFLMSLDYEIPPIDDSWESCIDLFDAQAMMGF